jgi:thiol-disulfide isomerase/thioredoxin
MNAGLRIVIAATVLSLTAPLAAGVLLQPKPAPEWEVSEWLNGDPGRLADHRTKVVIVEFFQLWCPVSIRFSRPLIERWQEKYGDRQDVLIVSIHTVFEAHDYQNPRRLREFIQIQGIDHPVGIDAYETRGDPTPITMERYETEGTPHVVIIDKLGMIRYSAFGIFDPGPVEAFIDRLLKEKPDKEKTKSRAPLRRR